MCAFVCVCDAHIKGLLHELIFIPNLHSCYERAEGATEPRSVFLMRDHRGKEGSLNSRGDGGICRLYPFDRYFTDGYLWVK